MNSLQARIALFYLALAALIVGVSTAALIELNRVADKARESGRVMELFDAILEMRRYEKSHLLYQQPADLAEHARYAARAAELLDGDAAPIDALLGAGAAAGLRRDLARYLEAIATHARHADDERAAEAARRLGKALVTTGERLAARERQALNEALRQHRRGLVLSLAVILALLAFTGLLLAKRVTRPLKAMEARMRAVADGSLARLAVDGAEREFVSLAHAFNHVLDELERRQRRLLRAEKLASLGTLLSSVAHELNNPLSNISSSAQILLEDGDLSPAMRAQLARDIDAETLRARRIARALLDYAGERAFSATPVALAELVAETLRFLKAQQPPDIRVNVDIPAHLLASADRPRLQQAILNLLRNAFEAMGARGELTIVARAAIADAHDPAFAHGVGECPPSGAVIDLTIADDGPGIAAEALARVFEPFHTGKAAGGGSGLGLFITREIVEQHGGCIGVANRPSGGAEFRLRLPAATEAT